MALQKAHREVEREREKEGGVGWIECWDGAENMWSSKAWHGVKRQ